MGVLLFGDTLARRGIPRDTTKLLSAHPGQFQDPRVLFICFTDPQSKNSTATFMKVISILLQFEVTFTKIIFTYFFNYRIFLRSVLPPIRWLPQSRHVSPPLRKMINSLFQFSIKLRIKPFIHMILISCVVSWFQLTELMLLLAVFSIILLLLLLIY